MSPSGVFIARVDFWWERVGLVGECDGQMKYETPADLYAEKRREDTIRAHGYRVIRWGPQDLRSTLLAQRLHRFHT
jgi:very-short-patch-repair endonuclease